MVNIDRLSGFRHLKSALMVSHFSMPFVKIITTWLLSCGSLSLSTPFLAAVVFAVSALYWGKCRYSLVTAKQYTLISGVQYPAAAIDGHTQYAILLNFEITSWND